MRLDGCVLEDRGGADDRWVEVGGDDGGFDVVGTTLLDVGGGEEVAGVDGLEDVGGFDVAGFEVARDLVVGAGFELVTGAAEVAGADEVSDGAEDGAEEVAAEALTALSLPASSLVQPAQHNASTAAATASVLAGFTA